MEKLYLLAISVNLTKALPRGHTPPACSVPSRLLSALVSVLIVSSDAQAASLTLGCTGTVTTSNVPKEGVVPDPDKDNVSDYSVVVDLDRHGRIRFLV